MRNVMSFLAVILFAAVACTTGTGGGSLSGGIVLSADKTSLLADGNDVITFTVKDTRSYADVTEKAVIKADGKPSGHTFSTDAAGVYEFTAEYDGYVSDPVTVTAVLPDAEGVTLSASKTSLYPDGGDFVVFSLTDGNGTDVTAQGTFYVDREKLAGNRFSTEKSSLKPLTASAEFAGMNVANTVTLTATSSYSFSSRMLLEEITRTSCDYCPIAIDVISELAADVPQVVVAYNVHNTVSSIYQNEYSQATKEFAVDFCKLMNEPDEDQLTRAPRTFVSRNKTGVSVNVLDAQELRNQAVALPKDVAIAIETEIKENKVSVRATVGSKKNFAGKLVAVLVENGIRAEQSSMGNIEMYRIMRAYAPSVTGKQMTFRQGEASVAELQFDLTQTTVRNYANCEVIVFVTDDEDGLCENVQVVKVGESKGY